MIKKKRKQPTDDSDSDDAFVIDLNDAGDNCKVAYDDVFDFVAGSCKWFKLAV